MSRGVVVFRKAARKVAAIGWKAKRPFTQSALRAMRNDWRVAVSGVRIQSANERKARSRPPCSTLQQSTAPQALQLRPPTSRLPSSSPCCRSAEGWRGLLLPGGGDGRSRISGGSRQRRAARSRSWEARVRGGGEKRARFENGLSGREHGARSFEHFAVSLSL